MKMKKRDELGENDESQACLSLTNVILLLLFVNGDLKKILFLSLLKQQLSNLFTPFLQPQIFYFDFHCPKLNFFIFFLFLIN